MDAAVEPARLTGLTALRWGWRFARDPLIATSRAFAALGPFVILEEALPLVRPRRIILLSVPLVLTAGAPFNSELLSAPDKWRGTSLLPGGPRGSAARRMNAGLTRLTGEQHTRYRKLLLPPLRRANVEAMAATMARLAQAEVASWPVGEEIELWDHVHRIMRLFAVELLFGGRSEQNCAIADLVSRVMERKWDWRAFAFPINLPVTTFGKTVREAELLERRILEWVEAKRGRADDRDLAAIIVNSRDIGGSPPDDATIVGQLASLFAAAAEASQSVLVWTLLLLTQHPRVAADLLREMSEQLGTTSPSLEKAGELSYLDAVVKESMRILPPVPLQMRVAQCDTTIAGHDIPKGTRVILNAFLTNRMPDLYPDGDLFRPERWSTIAPTAFEFPVFSAGPHGCPGYWFGSAAVKIALAAILTRYRVDLAAGARVDYNVQPTFRPRQSFRVLVHRRDAGKSAATPVTGTIRNLVKFPQ